MDSSYPWIRAVASPLTKDMLRPLDPRCRVVQFSSLLHEDDFARLAQFMAGSPELTLRAYGSYDGTITDLDFLRFFPSLRHFAADALYNSLTNLDGLGYLSADVESLTIGWTKKRLPLDGLARFRDLRTLHLEGQTKGIEVVGELQNLTFLALRSITLPDLSLLTPLSHLRALALKLGGTKNVDLLPSIGQLRYLELWMLKGMSDLRAINGLSDLRYLFLQSLRNVEALPDFAADCALRGVHLETMKGLKDLSALARARHLEQLVLFDMPLLQPRDLSFLIGHPSLKELSDALGSKKRHEAVQAMFRLPRVSSSKADWITDAVK
jgi:hypothetical protein